MARYRKNDAGERRTAHIGFYVTPSERAELARRAAIAGRGFSDFCRTVLLSDLKAPAPGARSDPLALHALRAQFAHYGNNLNQVAHHANARGDLPSQKTLAEMAALLRAAVEKVLAL